MARGYAGPPDPEKGMPHRHARAKIRLLMDGAVPRGQLEEMLLRLAGKYPDAVLTAVTDVLAENEAPDDEFIEAAADFIARNDDLLRRLDDEDYPGIGTAPRRTSWQEQNQEDVIPT